jgi:thymidylate synthase (FAD)
MLAFDNIPFWIPLSIQSVEGEPPHIRLAKKRSREVFNKAFAQAQENYAELLKIWNYRKEVKVFSQKKKLTSMFRRIIPIGVATGGVWSGNLRALRHIFTMRCSPAAEEEICLVAGLMLKKMMESEPLIFSDFHLVDGYWTPKYIKV